MATFPASSRVSRQSSTAPDAGPTVAQFCRKDFIAVPRNATVADVLRQVRGSAVKGNIFYLYVVDDADRLCGNLSIRSLITAEENTRIADIASSGVIKLDAETPVREAYLRFSNARFLSLPVTDRDGKIVGVVHAHELVDEYGKEIEELFQERSRGELFELLGVQAEDAAAGPWRIARGRLPWLMLNVVGGAFSAVFIHGLGGNIRDAVQYLAFVPILLILCESIGMQAASIVIANLHRTAGRATSRHIFAREMWVALLLGLACSTVVASSIFLWKRNVALCSAIAITLTFGALFVTFLGNAVPYAFHRLKIDPRIAAGPVVLALADSLTLLFYLAVAVLVTSAA